MRSCAAVVFSETGLLIGLVVPGDSLLFTVGVVAGAGHLNILRSMAVLITAAILGDSTGYLLGRKTGPRIFSRPDSRLFKQEYVTRTKAFYDRYGAKTILFARFLPVVRTFARLSGRSGADAVPAFPAVQHVWRPGLGGPADDARLQAGRHPDRGAQFR